LTITFEFFRYPENVRLGPLDLSHLDAVCKNWPHYSPDFRPVVASMITLNPSCGVFVRSQDGSEQLAAMVLQSEYGGLGLLQTVPEFRRRGYALLAVRQHTRTLGRAGVNVHCHVIVNNFGSLGVFKKSGLKIVALSNWIFIEPSIPKSH
jgi:ribosomal protein S18 acetylase RimI-like enzyme